jgi:hypothetical protein
MDTCFQAARMINEGVSLLTSTTAAAEQQQRQQLEGGSEESAIHRKFQSALTLCRQALSQELTTLRQNNQPIARSSADTVIDIPIEPVLPMMNAAASAAIVSSSFSFVYNKALKIGIESSLPTNMTTLEASCCMSSFILYNLALLHHMKGLALQEQQHQQRYQNDDRLVVGDDDDDEAIPPPPSRHQAVSSNIYYLKAVRLYRIVLHTLVEANSVLRGHQQREEDNGGGGDDDGDDNSLPLGSIQESPSSLFLQVVTLNNLGILLLESQQFGTGADGANNDRLSTQSSIRRIYLKLWDVLPTIPYERREGSAVAPAAAQNIGDGRGAMEIVSMDDAIAVLSNHRNDHNIQQQHHTHHQVSSSSSRMEVGAYDDEELRQQQPIQQRHRGQPQPQAETGVGTNDTNSNIPATLLKEDEWEGIRQNCVRVLSV